MSSQSRINIIERIGSAVGTLPPANESATLYERIMDRDFATVAAGAQDHHSPALAPYLAARSPPHCAVTMPLRAQSSADSIGSAPSLVYTSDSAPETDNSEDESAIPPQFNWLPLSSSARSQVPVSRSSTKSSRSSTRAQSSSLETNANGVKLEVQSEDVLEGVFAHGAGTTDVTVGAGTQFPATLAVPTARRII